MRNLFVIIGLIFFSLSCIDPPPAAVSVPDQDLDMSSEDMGQNNIQVDMTPGCVPEAAPMFCWRNNADCGDFVGLDNCNQMRTESCGGCVFGECEENECDAVRAICENRDAECGTILLVGGEEVDCGSCEAPDTCGGAGIDNKCGCTDVEDPCLDRMAVCGVINVPKCNTPEEFVFCGECPDSTPTCVEGECRCVPEAPETFCERMGKCGPTTGMDDCNVERTVQCGCELGEVCFEKACCVPETDGELCQALNPPEQPQTLCTPNKTVMDRCGQSREISCSCACDLQGSEDCTGRCGDFIDDLGCNKSCSPQCPGNPGEPEAMVCDSNNECCTPVPISGFCVGRCGNVSKTDNCGVLRTMDCGTNCQGLLRFCSNTYCVGL